MDEVHSLLERYPKGKLRFLLTGSSARKLKRTGANLLAGRALSLRLHPLTYDEVKLPLEKVLRLGSLPGILIDQEAPELALKGSEGRVTSRRISKKRSSMRHWSDEQTRFPDFSKWQHSFTVSRLTLAK